MPFLNDDVLDNGLAVLNTAGDAIHILNAEAATYSEATATYTVGNSAVSVGAPGARTGGGRKATVAAVIGGALTANSTASHYALVDTAGGRLLASAPLASAVAVTSAETFDLATFDIGIPGV